MVRHRISRWALSCFSCSTYQASEPPSLRHLNERLARAFLMASLLLLGRGEEGSSSDFYLEYLCRTSFRQFREPLRHTAARQLSPSMPRRVRSAIIPWARMAPALQSLEP